MIALLAVLSALLVTLLAFWLFHQSAWAGALAGLLFLFDPLTRYSGQRAMVDMPALFFSLLTLLLALGTGRAIRRHQRRTVLAWAAATGIACALAVGAKQNALVIPAVLIAWSALLLLRRPPATTRRSLLMAAAVTALVTAGVTWALNPYLYRSPLPHAARLLQTGQEVAQYDVPGPFRLDTLPRRVEGLVLTGLIETGPLYRTLPTLPWACLEPHCVPEIYVWGRPVPEGVLDDQPWWDVILACVGVLWLATQAWHQRRARSGPAPYALAWVAIGIAAILAWVPFAWERWYLPLEPIWALLEAAAIVAGVRLAVRAGTR